MNRSKNIPQEVICSQKAHVLIKFIRGSWDVDVHILNNIARKMENGEKVTPETDDEKLCFQLIKDLDHVGGHVKGSLTNKKYMRNEIWSLISAVEAPSWFITFSPADNMHPNFLVLC